MASGSEQPAVTLGPAARARRPARLADLVVESIVDAILSGELRPGSALPPESALSETFQVSRITVREAVKALEAKGLVAVRQGVGAVVTDDTRWNLLDAAVLAAAVKHDANLTILDELVQVRIALESSLAAEAAGHATDEDLAELQAIFHRLEADVRTPAVFIETDVEFHDRIMAASGNRLARSIVSTVHSQARTSLRYQGHPGVEDVAISNEEHWRILDRILDRDAAGAAQAMTDHIRSAWERRRPPARSGD
ncbi:DNA-binding FadR family transcriptional regulator [Kribbella amoyensis]|uniref:DNA-binding FadR family transcriptional regulator n=1 Tax=Kribbella amoyensis TaxID=996641 RepID=A0A561BS46_9ACTN|nr:FadR/GntR family transcriptional regulator [Kribbella amoyensis]TWD81718.1 DNA-binding FadR family transcriptional regulator [Kribbella amoyensis]